MTVKCLKSCPWGIHSAWGPEFQIEPGMVLGDEFPKGTNAKDWADFKVKLIDAGHAEIVPDEPADDEAETDEPENTGDATDDNGSDAENTDETDNSEGDTDTEVTPESLKAELEDIALKAMDDPMGSEQKTKAELETLGKERYDFDVDKRMSVDNIILAIVEAAFKE